MADIHAVTVYCSSSSTINEVFVAAAVDLGRSIAEAGWSLVYGGNSVGLMKTVSEAARGAGGRVIGITPQLMVDKGVSDSRCDELIVTPTMRERKQQLEQRGDALVALPGGIGTYEELFEVLVGKQLGYHTKPIVLMNTDGFFAPLLTMIESGISQHFIKPAARNLFFVAPNAAAAIRHLRTYAPTLAPQKWETAEVPSAIE